MKEIKQYLSYYMPKGKTPSDEGLRCAELLEKWLGLHHISQRALRKADWTTFYVQIMVYGSLSTFDFDSLTTLVFLCHDLCIRADIGGKTRGGVEILLHPRKGREGSTTTRHPTIEQALAGHRQRNPIADGEVVSAPDAAITVREYKANTLPSAGDRCGWCGRIYSEHVDAHPEGVLPRVPCQLLKSGFFNVVQPK